MSTSTVARTQKALVLISGASRGIGQAIAIAMAGYFAPQSQLVLLARDTVALNATRDHIRRDQGDRVRVRVCAIDLAEPTDAQLDDVFALAEPAERFDVAVCVHNVGTIGDIALGADACADQTMWQRYYALNVFAVARLNVRFLQHYAPVATGGALVVNVTSKCSSVPYASFTLYCTSRAAREMYFKVLAAERPDVRVLNYSPGVVDTAMTVDVQQRSASAPLRDYFRELRESERMLRPEQTAAQLMRTLEAGTYASGDYVDYYTQVEGAKNEVDT